MQLRPILVLISLFCATSAPIARAEEEIVITFHDATVGKAMPSWTARGVTFEPGGKLTRSKAAPRIMFFPHLMTEKKGVLNAMAAEAIPVQIRFPAGASKVTLVMWGSIGSSALVEALDKDGKVLQKASLEKVPNRASPAEPIPSFSLTVKSPQIASVRFGGAKPGGFLAAEEVRFIPQAARQVPD